MDDEKTDEDDEVEGCLRGEARPEGEKTTERFEAAGSRSDGSGEEEGSDILLRRRDGTIVAADEG